MKKLSEEYFSDIIIKIIFVYSTIYDVFCMFTMLSEYLMDINSFKLEDQYMLSDKLLGHPVSERGAQSVNVYFSSIDGDHLADFRFDIDYTKFDSVRNHKIDVDMVKVPVYQRGGTIIPKKETVRRSFMYMISDPKSLFVAVDNAAQANGTLFIDDGESYNYRRGRYLYLQFKIK